MYSVSSGGCHSRHPLDYSMYRPRGLPHYLLLIVKCPALFRIGAEEVRTEHSCAMLIRPNVPYQYRSISGEYTDDWLHFDCDMPDFPERTGLLFHRPIPIGSAVEFTLYIQQIMWEKNYASSDFREENIDMLMRVLVNNLVQAVRKKDSPMPYNPYIARLQNLRLSMQSQPYKNFTARGLILNTDLKLERIAQLSGYNSEIHFYRQFREKTGMTPREYLAKAKGENNV